MAEASTYIILGRGRWAQRMRSSQARAEKVATIAETRAAFPFDLDFALRVAHQLSAYKSRTSA